MKTICRRATSALVALLGVGLLGVFLKRFEWSRPAFLIGFVLSNQVEVYVNQAYQIASHRFSSSLAEGMGYIFTPIVLVIGAVTVLSVYFGLRQTQALMPEGDVASGAKRAPAIFTLVVMGYAAFALFDAWGIKRTTDMVIPAVFAIVAILSCVYLLIKMRFTPEGHPLFADSEAPINGTPPAVSLWPSLAWLVGLVALTGSTRGWTTP